MKATRMIAPLLGIALLGTGCSASASPGRAVKPSQRPVVLTMASPLTSPQGLDDYVHEVTALTGGGVRIDVKNGWRKGEIDFETGLIADVRAGKADLGVAGSRAFDSAGVLSFRALGAPLLITSYAAEEQVLNSPIVGEMLSGLNSAGLTGIGILPGDLRRPLGVTGPLVTPADYVGRTIGTQQSKVADETMRALGAKPVQFPVGGKIDRFDGVEQQISSIYGFQYGKAGRFVTANVALWPRPLVLFTTGQAMERLSSSQRQALKQAAVAALADSMARVRGEEQEAVKTLCRARLLTFDQATPDDLAALRTAVQPVYDLLKRDPQTKHAIAAITSQLQSVTPEAPPACKQPASPPDAGKVLLDGVYTMTTKFGDDPGDGNVVPENYGHWTFVFRGRHFAITQEYRNACTWGYGKLNVKGAQMEWTFTDGGGIAPDNAQNKPGEFFVFGWNLYRGTLTLTPVPGATSPANFRLKPWHRISTAPSARYFSKRCPPPADALG
jgi:TRAP-type C4-dicarboxylate transport system substrate-binding protein